MCNTHKILVDMSSDLIRRAFWLALVCTIVYIAWTYLWPLYGWPLIILKGVVSGVVAGVVGATIGGAIDGFFNAVARTMDFSGRISIAKFAGTSSIRYGAAIGFVFGGLSALSISFIAPASPALSAVALGLVAVTVAGVGAWWIQRGVDEDIFAFFGITVGGAALGATGGAVSTFPRELILSQASIVVGLLAILLVVAFAFIIFFRLLANRIG